MTMIQIELADDTAQAAKEAGLLTPQAMERLLTQALRQQRAADHLLSVAAAIEAADSAPSTPQDLQTDQRSLSSRKIPCPASPR